MASCKIEINYMDPTTYTAISSHEMRQKILTKLYHEGQKGKSMTKQELADSLNIKYQQLVYQLTNHISDFWKVVGEEKIRGTRMEYIAPANTNSVYICIGKDRRIYIVDPLAELYGPLDEVGCRCDVCSMEESNHCIQSLIEKNIIPSELTKTEMEILNLNKRKNVKPLDRGFVEAMKGIAMGDNCVLTIPCERCTFLLKRNLITIS